MRNDDVNAAMLVVAKNLSEQLGYIDLGLTVLDASRSWFWANRLIAATSKEPVRVVSHKYILPLWEDEIDENRHALGKSPS